MPVTVSTSCQSRFKDCCAPSSQVGLTLVSNGEEPVQVYTTAQTLVPAGFQAPTVAATMGDAGAGGVLPAGYVYYLYVYASSQYPNVEADTTAGGFEWPKSQPSPVSAVYNNTVNHKINVTVTKTTRADVDRILIYRTSFGVTNTPLSLQQIEAQAGQVFYVGFVVNDGNAGTAIFTDNVAAPQEELEVDNFPAPQFWFCIYVDPYWYGVGNPDLAVPVTLDSSSNANATTNSFFSGRQGQLVTFDGITTGGFDGKGTFYFLYSSPTVANVSVSADLSTTDFPGYVGTTTMRVRGYAGTLYRSKARNPFAWGYTEYQTAGDSQIRVTQTFAQVLGGYACAMALIPEQRLLKIDLERPNRSYAIDVSIPLESNFQQALKLLDSRYIVTSHFTQILALLNNGQTALRGFDSSNFAIVQGDASDQAPVSDEIFQSCRSAITAGDTARLFHGVFDPQTELSAFWIKTTVEASNTVPIDLCLLYHGPSGQWSTMRDFGITASESVYDPVTLQTITLVGTMDGVIAQAFVVSANLFEDTIPFAGGNLTSGSGIVTTVGPTNYFLILFTGTVLNGQYFDISPGPGEPALDRFYFKIGSGADTPPAVPPNGRLFKVVSFTGDPGAVPLALRPAIIATGSYDAMIAGNFNTIIAYPLIGGIPDCDSGTCPAIVSYLTTPTGSWNVFNSFYAFIFGGNSLPGCWALFCDPLLGTREAWGHILSFTATSMIIDLWVNPYTLQVSTAPPSGTALAGDAFMLGLINCEAQTCFQPSMSDPSQMEELWATIQNVSAASQWGRIYQEFDSTYYETPFPLVRDTRQNGVPSDNWITSTGIPSTLVNQFGLRLIERGFGDFRLLGFTVMAKAAK